MSVAADIVRHASRAELVAALLLLDPTALGGVVVRAQPGPQRDAWLARIRGLLPAAAPWRRIPVGISSERLLGGLDFSATLDIGKPVYTSGVLASCDGGIVVLAMAERIASERAAIIAAVLDQREVAGVDAMHPCRIGIIAVDEGLEDDEILDPALADRLAFQINAEDLQQVAESATRCSKSALGRARNKLSGVTVPEEITRSLAATSAALGIASLRGDLFAMRVCKMLAALRGRSAADSDDAALAAQLVLAHRARYVPMDNSEPEQQQDTASPDDNDARDSDSERPNSDSIDDVVLDAARAAVPPQLLSAAEDFRRARDSGRGRGRAGKLRQGRRTGRIVGATPAERQPEGRLHLLATLRAALPWQTIRRNGDETSNRIRFKKSDLQVARLKDRNESTTVFVVDASGSQAAQRLGEVKGAIELLIADCYVRRDQVALIAFRKKQADILLAPTRALARAKRTLAELPGGGGTPLSAGIDKARLLVDAIRRQGRTPQVVFLTDGRANVSRDGSEGHESATAEALQAAKLFRLSGLRPVVVDTSRRPRPAAREFAEAMAAAYVPLPHANAAAINSVVGQLTTP